MKYRVNEIFYSIQGEGCFTGAAAIFIRFSGCNLKCPFCDTKHNDFKEMDITEIYEKIKQYQSNMIVLTGGEPTLQNIEPLIKYLQKRNKKIHIETNGTGHIKRKTRDGNLFITCSPKKEADYVFYPDNVNELKYVIKNGDSVDHIYGAGKYNKLIYIQPESNKKENIDYCVKIVKENPQWKLSLQMHKLISIR